MVLGMQDRSSKPKPPPKKRAPKVTQDENLVASRVFGEFLAKLDATNLSSLAKEYRAGLLDPGQIAFDLDVDVTDAGQVALQNYRANATIANFKLTLPNAHTATFQGFVESFPWDGGVDALLTSTCNIIITGPVTIV